MSTVPQILKRNAYAFAAGLFLLAATVPSIIVPRLASAAQITERSIEMSTSTENVTAVYQVSFKPATSITAKAFVVDFCTSPIIGLTCTKPTGLSVATTPTSTALSGWTLAGANTNRTFTAHDSTGVALTAGNSYSFDISGITNPNEGTFYARIYTYNAEAGATGFPSNGVDPDTGSAVTDSGSVALSATTSIQVSATVQESLVFCVAGESGIADGCSNLGSLDAPSIQLGEGTPPVLDANNVSTAPIYYQLSTNASGATTIRMKGASAVLTSGSNTIPALAGADSTAQTMTAGTAAFGMRSAGTLGGDSGTVTVAAPYDSSTNFGNDSSGITGTYGDIIAQATGAVLNVNTPLEFGATASATTPAGIYTAAFSLIATSSY